MVYDYLLLRLQNNRIQIRILCIPECVIYNLKSRFSALGNNTLGNNCSILILRHLLIIFQRELTREQVLKNEYLDHEMDTAVTYFNENYNRDINIEEYATSKGMSVSWFIRSFKKFTGSTPMQFIVALRVNNAQVLLETTNYSINEISKIVGYDNQLYFSRLFHKLKGFSPREYRKTRKSEI